MAFCNSGQHEYLRLCDIPVRTNRDGYAGPNARIYLPFYGHYFFSGAQIAFPNSTVPQDRSRTIGGRDLPGCYEKGFTCNPSTCR